MIVSDDDPARACVGDMLQDVRTETLRDDNQLESRLKYARATCDACMTIRSFMRDQPASMRPRSPRQERLSGLDVLKDIQTHACSAKLNTSPFHTNQNNEKRARMNTDSMRFSNSSTFFCATSSSISFRVSGF